MAGPASPAVPDEIVSDGVSGEDRDLTTTTVKVSGRVLSLAEFLLESASSLPAGFLADAHEDGTYPAFARARDLFLRAGVTALEARGPDSGWLQRGLQPVEAPSPRPDLHRNLGSLGRRLLTDGSIRNFFFMNKAPGLRIRFEAADISVPTLAAFVDEEIEHWMKSGLVEAVTHGIYEPETHLFGGPASMPWVHSLFTHDALLWLDYFGSAESREASPPWLLSLAVLQALFEGLAIEGWEDVGVWDRVRGTTGRRLAAESQALPAYQETADAIRNVWSRRDSLAGLLDPDLQARVEAALASIRMLAEAWRSEYFNTSAAYIGTRTAAAFWVVFHWNRGALSATQQALMAEALAARMG